MRRTKPNNGGLIKKRNKLGKKVFQHFEQIHSPKEKKNLSTTPLGQHSKNIYSSFSPPDALEKL
jgi:hypothetical protein